MPLDPERAKHLTKAKLEGLVRANYPDLTAQVEAFTAGAVVRSDRQIVAYAPGTAVSPLAAALGWAHRYPNAELHVLADAPDPLLELMASGLDPVPLLHQISGTSLIPMDAPPLAAAAAAPAAALEHLPMLEAAGCEVVVEHGAVIGEINGIEVARVAIEASGEAIVRVGVGLYDQEAHALVHADLTIDQRLDQVITEVNQHRNPTAAPHPINRVARERWLRAALIKSPDLLGLATLSALPPLTPRTGIRDEQPAAALGSDGTQQVLVVTGTGVDLDVVPYAAGHLAQTRAKRIILVLPAQDHHQVIERMASRLGAPASVAAIPEPWQRG